MLPIYIGELYHKIELYPAYLWVLYDKAELSSTTSNEDATILEKFKTYNSARKSVTTTINLCLVKSKSIRYSKGLLQVI